MAFQAFKSYIATIIFNISDVVYAIFLKWRQFLGFYRDVALAPV